MNKILKEQLDWYKEELKKANEGYQYSELINAILDCVRGIEQDEDEDYDEYSAINDIKWHLRQYKLIK